MNIAQDSQEWHDWRSKGLGASDAPVVMFVSPWKTLEELWVEKVTGKSLVKENYAMKRGKDLEPIARDIYEFQYGVSMPPRTGSKGILLASLDGYLEQHKGILEIKSPLSKKEIEAAKLGLVPGKYYPQIQQQLYVFDANYCDYCTFDGENEIYVSRVFNDYKYQRELVRRSNWFWKQVVDKKELKFRRAGVCRDL